MARSGCEKAGSHVLVIPFPAQGHMIPLLDLTHKLASNNSNLTITILTTPNNQTLLTPILSSHPSVHPLLLPFPSHPSLPGGVENAKDMPHSMQPIILSLSSLHRPLLHWFHSHPSPPHFIISDMFCGWSQQLASQVGIKRLVFSPSAAFAFSIMCVLWKELPKCTHQNEVVSFHRLPNSPKYPWWQVSPLYRSYASGEAEMERFKDWYLGNIASWGLVLNTFDELEKPYLDFLKRELGHDRVWAIGPLLPADDSSLEKRGGSSSVVVNDVVSWLDEKDDRKVVYVCFGSQTILTEDQTDAIASALLKSGVHFIWSMKEAVNGRIAFPLGFEEGVRQKGLVIRGWAPQVVILRHRAVGAFLTHCGWNSVLESVVAGVPLLAWPMTADQFVDATLLVEQLKVARMVCEGEKTVPDVEHLGRVLAESVSENGAQKREALRLQAAALDAVRNGGSSEKDLGCLMGQLLLPFEK
ncbi:flavonol 3-O-glucosyltransferase UGT89B1 [Abrus precatorius]|uniref:Glycosyltransferase n=1 Tax=Abrus precatorius TaxID=3816 RepID=A0A8B8KZ70_ABRPR|nr:flavonol 3-O-glucosyltransferase UGT89B1 [Abrus precatorius]